jgi:hypothetical protein
MSALIPCPLDLPDVEVWKTARSAAGHRVITVESTLQGTRCRRCGREIREPYGRDRPRRLLPVLEPAVDIEIRPKRSPGRARPGAASGPHAARAADPALR